MNRKLHIVIATLALAVNAHADNIFPPDFVGDDPAFETFQEWEFVTPGTVIPDGELGFANSGGTPMATPGSGVLYDPLGAGLFPALDGYIGIAEADNTITFDVPNVPDDRPVKNLRIQINGDWTAALGAPTVSSLTATDSSGPTSSGFVDSDNPFPGFHRWEDWDIFPNPDHETLVLTVPVGAMVSQVVIHTISIPEPATALLSSAPAAFLLTRRRARMTEHA